MSNAKKKDKKRRHFHVWNRYNREALTFLYASERTSNLNPCGISLALYLLLSRDSTSMSCSSAEITVDTKGLITPAAFEGKLYFYTSFMFGFSNVLAERVVYTCQSSAYVFYILVVCFRNLLMFNQYVVLNMYTLF